jgi:hypothetical protein
MRFIMKMLLMCFICAVAGASAVTPQTGEGGVVIDPQPAGCGNRVGANGEVHGFALQTFSGHHCEGAPRGC